MADELLGTPPAAATPAPAPAATPAAPSTPQTGTFSGGPGLTPPPSPSGLSASPGTPPGAVTPPAATPAWSLRSEAAKAFPGVDARFADDQSLAAELIRAAAQFQQVSPLAALGQKYHGRQAEIDAWLAEQDKVKKAQAAAAQPKWWAAPDYDPAWLQGVLRDHTGALVAKPGYPPDLPAKIEAYQNFQVDKLHAIMKDPVAALRGGLEPLIQEIAGKIVGERQAASQQEQFATGYVAQNAAWLMEKDAAGNPAYGPDGKPVLTAAGQRFRQHVADLVRDGVTDPRVQQRRAEERLELDILRLKLNPQNPAAVQPAAPAAPAAPAFAGLNGAGHQPPYGAAVTPPAAQSLDQMLREAAQAAGLMSSTPAASL